MAARQVQRLELDPRLQQLLQANNLITARDVLNMSMLDLMELLDLTLAQADHLLRCVSSQVSPAFVTAHELLQQAAASSGSYLHTGLPALDGALRRGIPPGALTELVGPGGVGKSQFCHMMALLTALPSSCGGLEGSVVYVDTERKFQAQRLVQMAHARAPAAMAAAAGGEALAKAVLTRIVIMYPSNVTELKNTVQNLEVMILQHKARLVVLDSIAALARAEFGAGGPGGSLMERQELLGQMASHLKHVAETLQVPVLVTNQVTTRVHAQAGHQGLTLGMAGAQGPGGPPQQPAQGYLTAALGAKWAHCVNVRVILERVGERRFLKVAKSPASANVVLEYGIGPGGLEQLQEGGDLPQALQGKVLEMAIANDIDYGIQP